jgi:hypothetical protein
MHNRQGLTPKLIWQSLTDYDLWPIYLLGLTWTIPATPVTAYLTLNLKALGFDTFQTNLLTIPAWFLFLLQLLFWTWVSEKINNRFLIVLFCQIWFLPLAIALETLPDKASPWSWYSVSALMVGHPYIHAILGKSPSWSCVYFSLAPNGFSSGPHIAKCRLCPHEDGRFRSL